MEVVRRSQHFNRVDKGRRALVHNTRLLSLLLAVRLRTAAFRGGLPIALLSYSKSRKRLAERVEQVRHTLVDFLLVRLFLLIGVLAHADLVALGHVKACLAQHLRVLRVNVVEHFLPLHALQVRAVLQDFRGHVVGQLHERIGTTWADL